MEYNQNIILIITSCKSISSPTGFCENFTKSMECPAVHGTGGNSGFDPHMRSYTCEMYMWSHMRVQTWCHCHNMWHGFFSPNHHHQHTWWPTTTTPTTPNTWQWQTVMTAHNGYLQWWPTTTYEHKWQQTPTTTSHDHEQNTKHNKQMMNNNDHR